MDSLHKFYDKVESELDILSRKETLSPTELENGMNAVCTLEKILKIDSIINESDKPSYGYFPDMNFDRMHSGRNRDSMGRFTNNSGRMMKSYSTPHSNSYGYNSYGMNSYGNETPKERLMGKISDMMRNAENEYEEKEYREFMNHVEKDYV